MKHIKDFEEFLNESGPNPKAIRGRIGNITWRTEPAEMILDMGYDSTQDCIETIIDDIGLASGEIDFDGGFFLIDGKLKSGEKIYVYQDGEYDMYGGPYDPKMDQAEVTIGGMNMYAKVQKAFNDYGWDDDINISRTDIWGHICK